MNARRLVLATLATLCMVAGGLFAGAAAQAELTHPYTGHSFGPEGLSSGGPLGVFGAVKSVAVDQSSGDVYVFDAGKEDIYKFNAAGEPVNFSALGTNVIEGVVSSGGGAEQEIAVDSSTGPDKGDIYVANNEVVLIYGEDGKPVEVGGEPAKLTGGEACGVAVDPSGDVYVGFYPETVRKYAPVANPVTDANETGSMGGLSGICNVAVDGEGNVYAATYSGGVNKYGPLQFGSLAATGTLVDEHGSTLAVDQSTNGDVYIDEGAQIAQYDPSVEPPSLLEVFGASEPGALSGSVGVAVSHSSGEVYAANGNGTVEIFGSAVLPDVSIEPISGLLVTSVTLNGTVNPDGIPVSSCEFEYGPTAAYGQTALCAPAPAQIGGAGSPVAVRASLTGLQPGSTYHYRLDAGNASGTNKGQDQTFTTPGPSIDGESASNVTSTSVALQAQINPNGQDTTYYFQYGTSSSYDVSVPVAPGADIGSGSSDQAVSQAISALAPSTSYHYRVVAVNALATHYGPDQAFGTNATPAAPPSYSSSPGLPDGRVYEQVSPADKNGNGAGSGSGLLTVGGSEEQYSVASADGNALLFFATGAVGNASSGIAGYFVARRSAAGWITAEATPRPTSGSIGAFSTVEAIVSSSDLSHVAFGQPASLGGFAGAVVGSQLYLAGSDPLTQPAWLNQPVISDPILGVVPLPAGASPDLSAVYFGYNGTLLAQDASRTPYAGKPTDYGFGRENEVLNPSADGFYEWRNGVLMPAGVLPDGSIDPFGAVPAATVMDVFYAFNAEDLNNQVSTDGSHAFFVSPDPSFCAQNSPVCGEDRPELYVRVTAADGSQSTALVSRSAITGQPAPHGPLQTQNPHRAPQRFGFGDSGWSQPYVYASPDGSQAFFESMDQLTSDAPADSSVKEYDFNVATGSLTYLPGVADLPPESASAQNRGPLGTSVILASAQDGSDFIFVRYPASGVPQLDLWRSGSGGGTITPISQLPPSPAHESAYSQSTRTSPLGDMSFVGARASADGSVFMFETDSRLPGGFNNAPGYEEIYRYDAAASALSCVSCPPAGITPSGDAQFSHNDLIEKGLGSLGVSLNADRGMSADGSRIFFDTPDSLVTQDTNGVRDVYEWENGRIYLLSSGTSAKDSLISDISPSGNDVFFATTDGLVAGDTDGAYDVYDARIPRPGDIPPPSAVPCQGDVCQGPPRVPSLLGTSPSETFSGPGNPTPLPAAKAVTHKQVKKKKPKKKAKKHKQKRKTASTHSKGRRK